MFKVQNLLQTRIIDYILDLDIYIRVFPYLNTYI